MPQVPIYNGPQVREQATQGGYQQEVDVTKGQRALAKTLDGVADVADRAVQREVETQANAADLDISSGWLKWDAENRKNYQGAKAGEYTAAAEKWWQDTAKTYSDKLDPFSKRAITQTLQRRQAASLNGVTTYVEGEKERHADQTAAANIDTTIQFGVTSGDLAGAAERVRELSAQTAARKGWTTEQLQAETLKNLSSMHIAQIAKLTEQPGGAEAAEKYYQTNKAEVGFAQQPRIEQVIKAEVDNQFATQFAAQQASKPLSEQLAAAGEIKDPAKREKALQQVKLNHAMVKEAEAAQQRQFSDTAWQLVGQGKRVPEAILAGMDGRERVQLQDHLRARAERLASGTTVKTNPAELAKVYDMMRDDPEGFKKLRMQTLTNAFAPNDIEQVARLQRDMLKPDREKDVATTSQLLSTYTGGWKPEKRATFEAVAYDELNRLEKEKGRPANYEEKKKTLDRLMMDGEVLSGSWYLNDPDKKLYETKPEERARFAPTISSTDRDLVKSALQSEGVTNPTDAQITERFKLAKGIK